MSFLTQARKSNERKAGDKYLLFGPPGSGKSTLASNSASPFFVDYDHGIKELSVMAVDGPRSWLQALAGFREFAIGKHDYKTFVIDTIDPLEELAVQHVCAVGKKASLGDFGFGDGYAALKNEWRTMLSVLDTISDKGINICLLAHSVCRTTSDPQLGPYEVYTTGLQKGTWAVTARWCDLIGFCAYEASRLKDEKRAIYTGRRELLTTAGSGYVAKNRWGLPARMPLDWKSLQDGIRRFNSNPTDVIARVRKLADGTTFVEAAETFIADAQGDIRRLLQVEDALKEKLAETAKEAAEAAKETASGTV